MKKLPLKILLKVQKSRLLAAAKDLQAHHHKVLKARHEMEKIEIEKIEIKSARGEYLEKNDFQKVENCDLYLEVLERNRAELKCQRVSLEQELQKYQEKYQAVRFERKKIELLVEKG